MIRERANVAAALRATGRFALEEWVGTVACEMAFYLFLGLFPFLIFLAALLPYLSIPDLLGRTLALLDRLLPPQAVALVETNLADVLLIRSGSLLTIAGLGTLFAVYNAIASLIGGLNRVFSAPETRPLLRRVGVAAALAIVLAALLAGAAVTIAVTTWYLRSGWAGTAGAFALVAAAFALLYRFGSCAPNTLGDVLEGSLLAAICWFGSTAAFSAYVANFGTFGAVYGTLGAPIVLLLWLWISSFFVLLGAEWNQERRRPRSRLRA